MKYQASQRSPCGPLPSPQNVESAVYASEHLLLQEDVVRRRAFAKPPSEPSGVIFRKREQDAPQIGVISCVLILDEQGCDMATHILVDLFGEPLHILAMKVPGYGRRLVAADMAMMEEPV